MHLLKNNLHLVFVSFIILFLELLIIRLVGTEIRIFAYLSNLILLATFVGLGLGMIIKKDIPLLTTSFCLFLTLIATSINYIIRFPNLEFKFFSGVTELLAPLSESYIWLQANTYSKSGIFIGLFLAVLLFINITLIFIPLGQIMGKLFAKHNKPILAYSLNIVASIIGLWAFQYFSILRFSPYLGIIIVLFGLIFLAKDKTEKIFLLVMVAVSIAFIAPTTEAKKITYWSPYQKLSLAPAVYDTTSKLPQPEGWYLEVNNVGYMSLLNLSNEYQQNANDELIKLFDNKSPIDPVFSNHYSLPYQFKKAPQNVLIIGAGAGNDAAAGVRQGKLLLGSLSANDPQYKNVAPKIDAVEIDPTIIEIGKKYHYEKPYQQWNVNTVVDDGRSFMEKTNKKYDIVIMGLADSHTLSSSLTNLRLDHYLYTKESFQRIKTILKDDGILFLTFEVTRPWIGERINRGLVDVFGHQAKIFQVRSSGVYGWGGYSFVISKNENTVNNILNKNDGLSNFINQNSVNFGANTKALTDDWPYLYLDKPRLPIIHLLLAIILGSCLLFIRKRILGKNQLNWPMFFWGAAFLLFEFQNVSKSSLLFGVTWTTNLFTISAILILILFANWTTYKKLITSKTAFVFLIVTLIIQILIPLHILNSFNFWQKLLLANLVLNLPLYFGGVIFIDMFQRAKDKANALGSNFIGSVFGGLLEMTSFLFGVHFLLYLIIILYSLGFMASKYLKINFPKLFHL